MFFFLGSLQRRPREPRLPEGVDFDAPRHKRRAVLRPARDRPALQVGHRQEGARGREEDVKKERGRRVKGTEKK